MSILYANALKRSFCMGKKKKVPRISDEEYEAYVKSLENK